MISGIFDKLIFGTVLLALMQLPLLTDHYLQYLQGYFDAVQKEVARDQVLAQKHNYPSVQALIEAHKTSHLPSVKADAENKSQRLAELAQLQQGISVLSHGHLGQKVMYMLNPGHSQTLVAVTQNFKPGIPLSPQYLLICALMALAFNMLGALPIKIVRRIKQKKRIKEKPL